MSAIKINRLCHTYATKNKTVTAVDDVTLDIGDNEFFTLLGPSGCGKTTTLRCIAGLEQPTSGSIELGGVVVVSDRVVVPTHRRDIGMVFQDYAVWPHMSVFDNVAFPLRIGRKLRRAEIAERVEQALELVNMSQYIDRRATQLSGGQQQRLSLARALVRQPKVLLLDEPLSNLDAKLREQMRSELRLIQQRIGITAVFVTHDQVEALSLSTRIAVMSSGRVVQEGTPREIYLEPNSEFVANFVGATSFVAGRVLISSPVTLTVQTELGTLNCRPHPDVPTGASAIVALRPESLVVTDSPTQSDNCFAGEVELSLFVGDGVDYRIKVGDQSLRARGSARAQFDAGDTVYVNAATDDCVVLLADPDGAKAVMDATDVESDR
ncbi:ABC transporter ATP-binding protein [Sphaerisporangium perillae]|uniref:ABC transporter ATP-binding protein n=1 Tax=Sphaerisporangium perillae TaxID=2935860 RepID=UPI00200D5F0D|nr:ABC transporter ATP-binding protein [Sphaerisporangium perillae]